MEKIYFLVWVALCFITCKPVKNKKDLKNYFNEEFRVEIPAQVHTLVVLDEVGCKGCNTRLHNWIQKKALDHQKIWVLVVATGTHLDISPYLNVRYKNVFVEQNIGGFKEVNLFASSGFVFLKDGKVEKTYMLTAQELDAQFKMLEDRLKL